MSRQIIVNATPQEARVAVLEGARLAEVFVERIRERGIAGSIYKGRVTRVLPGMQSAFVEVGLPKAAFLHASDFFPNDELEPTALDDPSSETAAAIKEEGFAPLRRPLPPIEERLKKGQELIVQIAKEPMGTKGARVTCNISIPGRHVVFLPHSCHVGISRRIEDEAERQRLAEVVASVQPNAGGVILRTASEGLTKKEIQSDLRTLRKLWDRIAHKAESLPTPSLLHSDLDVVLRTVRDELTTDVARIVIDNRRDYQRTVDFVETVLPRWRNRVELYEHPEPVFERYGIESQIARAIERRVWLKSGGYIVVDHTEALTAIDVNTGRFTSGKSQEETILRTNMEAARTIVEQIKLRNLGGLIIIDFIDMENPEHRQAVLAELTEALKSDKARSTILGISELGLLEMTRKRVRESLAQRLCEPCPTCNGRGNIKSTSATVYEILRRIRREVARNPQLESIRIGTHPNVIQYLNQHEPAAIREIEHELSIHVELIDSAVPSPDQYEVTCVEKPPSAQSTTEGAVDSVPTAAPSDPEELSSPASKKPPNLNQI